MEDKKKYYLQLSVVCVGTLLFSYGLAQLTNKYFHTNHFWVATLFFALTTVGTNALLTNSDKTSKEFVFKTLALSMARLLVCMIVVFIYSLIFKNQALAFTCHFMIHYLIFTVFEISFLLKYIKGTS
ncbi:MAG: hypothetical protein K0R26_1529 [Bacteroidota bacterium]|jgi:hypothetical protein|nr:hypothetical protein [Bacteroidota bacterium]